MPIGAEPDGRDGAQNGLSSDIHWRVRAFDHTVACLLGRFVESRCLIKSVGRKRSLVRITIIILLLVVALPVLYCCGIPLITGQACSDWLSWHVPSRAIDRFLERVFEATVARDQERLATVSDDEVLAQLRDVLASVTADYEIILSDNLAGLYEYRIRFDSGATAYVTLQGEWPTCPDFRVTEEETSQNIRLTSIHPD